jgi:hypothetical protein
MNYQKLLKKAEKEVSEMAGDNSPKLLFHNLDYTKFVVKAAEKIAEYSGLGEEERFVLLTAAWFSGNVQKKIKAGEQEEQVIRFLNQQDVSISLIKQVTDLMSSAVPAIEPQSLTEEIYRDALTYYYGKKCALSFFESQRMENELLAQSEISRDTWNAEVLEKLENHKFYTIYCRQTLDTGKTKNTVLLKEQRDIVTGSAELSLETDIHPESNKRRSAKGIDTIFKIAESNNQRLSIMADTKARILITVNSIILSAVISILVRKLVDNRDLILPTILLLTVSLVSISLSILSTRPAMPKLASIFNRNKETNINLLFFGSYNHMSLDNYRVGVRKMMENIEDVYDTLITDIHSEGKVLAQKYKLLRWSYSVFMYGLIVATAAFIVAAVIQPPKLDQLTEKSNKISLHHF